MVSSNSLSRKMAFAGSRSIRNGRGLEPDPQRTAESFGRREARGSSGEKSRAPVILWGIRWYVAYPISYRQLEEMLLELGIDVDRSTLTRWVMEYVSLLDDQFRPHKSPGSGSRLDETPL